MALDVNISGLIDESNDFTKWNGGISIILITILIISGVTCIGLKGMVIHYIYFVCSNVVRPINTMILKDHIILVSTYTVLFIFHLYTFTMGLPSSALFGYIGCTIFWASAVILSMTVVVSSFGMALFRYLCVVHQDRVLQMGINVLKNHIFIMEAIIFGIFGFFYIIGKEYGGAMVTTTFCYGVSSNLHDVVIHHQNGPEIVWIGKFALLFVRLLSIVLVAVELILYAGLFKVLYHKDQAMIGPLRKMDIKKRHKKNAITLCGQALSFVIETVAIIVLQMITMIKADSVFFQPAAGTFYITVVVAGVSVAQFCTSPELRRYYLRQDV